MTMMLDVDSELLAQMQAQILDELFPSESQRPSPRGH